MATRTRARVRPRNRYQTLSTIVIDDQTDAEAAFQVYPTDPLVSVVDPRYRGALPLAPLLSELDWVEGPDEVPLEETPLSVTLANALILDPEERVHGLATPDLLDFALFLVREPVLPFRRSPIEGKSLLELVRSRGPGTGAATGAFVGVLVAGQGPLLLVTVPGGMIIGGAAWAVATAVEQGLHDRVLRWFNPPD